MPRSGSLVFVGALALATLSTQTMAGALPRRVGHCAATRISGLGERLEDGLTHQPIAGSGNSVGFANGGHQVSYDELSAITRSRIGDPVRMCLVSIPRHCPPGDARGRKYRTLNLRTRLSWTLLDSEHMCGGA